MCIEDVFCFKIPIGWNEIGVIATVLAVVVALAANRKSSKQLKSALEMQEQSKNVDLLDKRVELAEAIQSGKSVSELTLRVLFNDEIFKHYKAWKDHLTKKVYAEDDLEKFYDKTKTRDGAGGYITTVKDNFERFMAVMSRPECPQRVFDDYQKYCDEHIVYLLDRENRERISYNHSEIKTRIIDAIEGAKKEQALTLQLIETFISDSIQPVDMRPQRKLLRGKEKRD